MSIPETMKAVEISAPGAAEVLRLADRPVPSPGPDEVLVRVAAAGVNRADVMQRQGSYPPPPGASDIPGLELSGTVAAVGAGVESLSAGEEVCALVAGGGYAEYCLVPAPQCLPLPPGVTLRDAAALPEAYCTVWTNVFERGRLAAGETLLVHGGSSGVGTAAIQLARAFGARVLATAGSPAKCAACAALGAELAVNYRERDFVAAVREATGGRGADVILDLVGGAYLQRNLDCLAVEGRLVLIAVMGGSSGELNLAGLMSRRQTLTGSTLRSRPVAAKAAICDALRARVWPRFDDGALRPVIHGVYPLAEAAAAHRVMESSAHVGKLLLEP
ncbi:MAG: NAD(P)H-quinone oxidoreductase [Acidobacteria bacterium]|nr:NAD(P)H-quinone oxidoreductase [Acidobacteriota bacterium]MYI75521.1 NAD(P)H-quinone oxidoreductase [Acidobacteriota bacterium]